MFFSKKQRYWLPFAATSSFLVFLFLNSSHLTAQDSAALKEVVIQATRAGEKGPVPFTNIKATQIARINQGQDVPFLLSSVPSLVETSDAGAGVGYTGLRIRGSDPTRINVTINGVPLNDAESQGMYWVDLPDLASSASEIQVQRGVGVSTNGAGAFGATINVDLSKVSAEPSGQISSTYGSFNTRKLSFLANTGLINDHFSFGARVSTIQSDGFIDRAASDLKSVHLTGAYISDRQSVQVHVLDGQEQTYQSWYGLPAQYYDAGSPLTYNPAGTERSDIPHPNEVDNYHQRHHLLHYKRMLAPGLILQLNGHYTRGKGYYEQYKANETLADYNMPNLVTGDSTIATSDIIRRLWLDNYFYGTTWALVYNKSKMNMTWGGGWSRYTGQHFGEVIWAAIATAPTGNRYYENDAAKNDFNSFVKAEMPITKKLSGLLDLQIRTVHYSFLGFNTKLENVTQNADLLFFNPKAGLNYAINKKSNAYLFAGVGNREPNRDDYTQSTPESRPKAERMYDVETGYKAAAGNWSFNANLFGMYYHNQLVLDGRINNVGAYIRTNVPQSYRAGIELEGTGRLLERVTLAGNLSLSRNKILNFSSFRDDWSTGEQLQADYKNTDLAFSPNVIGYAEAGFAILPTGNRQQLTATVSGKYVGRQFLDNTSDQAAALAGFAFANFRLNYDVARILGKKISVIATVNNLFNAHYASNGWIYRFNSSGYDPRPDDPYSRRESGDAYHEAGYFPQAGRNYLASLVVTF